MNNALKPIILLVVGAALGFFAARVSGNFNEVNEYRRPLQDSKPPPQPSHEQTQTSSYEPIAATEAGSAEDVTNFQGRYQGLLSLPNGPDKIRQISELFEAWGEAEGEAAYRFAKGLTGRDRLAYLASAAKGWASVAPQAAWAATMAATNDGAMLTQLVGPVVDELARQDPVLAMELLSEVGSHWNRNRLLTRVLDGLESSEDRSRFLESLLATQSEGNEQAVKALFHNWGRFDTDEPLEAARSIADPKLARSAVLGILEGWATVDGRGAFDYIVDSGDARLIRDALAPVAKEWARSTTADEMGEVFNAVSGVENSDAIIKNLVADLARADPELAMASVMSLEDESAQANHARDALSIWADADLDKAEAYFNTLPPGQTKNYAIWGLFNPAVHQGSSPQRIIGHAASLGDVDAIGHALNCMAEYTRVADLGEWTDQLSAELESYVTEHPDLPAEVKEKILTNLIKRRE